MPDGLPPELRVGLFAAAKDVSGADPVRHATSKIGPERDVRGMSIKVSGRAAADNLTAGESSPGFRPQQPPGDDGRRNQGLPRSAAGRGSGRRPRGRSSSSRIRAPPPWRSRRGSTRRATSRSRTGARRRTSSAPAARSSTSCAPPRRARHRCRIRLTDNYLRERLAAQLAREEARFDFFVQFQTDAGRCPSRMPASNGGSTIRRTGASPGSASRAQALDGAERAVGVRADVIQSVAALPSIGRSATSTARGATIYRAMAAFRRERAHP